MQPCDPSSAFFGLLGIDKSVERLGSLQRTHSKGLSLRVLWESSEIFGDVDNSKISNTFKQVWEGQRSSSTVMPHGLEKRNGELSWRPNLSAISFGVTIVAPEVNAYKFGEDSIPGSFEGWQQKQKEGTVPFKQILVPWTANTVGQPDFQDLVSYPPPTKKIKPATQMFIKKTFFNKPCKKRITHQTHPTP